MPPIDTNPQPLNQTPVPSIPVQQPNFQANIKTPNVQPQPPLAGPEPVKKPFNKTFLIIAIVVLVSIPVLYFLIKTFVLKPTANTAHSYPLPPGYTMVTDNVKVQISETKGYYETRFVKNSDENKWIAVMKLTKFDQCPANIPSKDTISDYQEVYVGTNKGCSGVSLDTTTHLEKSRFIRWSGINNSYTLLSQDFDVPMSSLLQIAEKFN